MRRKIILVIISILILTLSVLGITYAFMRPQVEEKEEKSNITINACAKVQLKDNGSVINLKNSYPMADEMGLETNPYEFTVTSTCDNYVGFNLYLTSLTTNEIEDNNIHFAIASQEDTVLVSDILNKTTDGVKDFNTDELKELDLGIKGTHKNIYKVYSNNIPLKGESNYKLYLWVDKDASKETMGKSFKVGLSVKSYNREESLAEYLIKNKDNTLIYHDGKADYDAMENYELEAEDLSYRYVGTNPNNYVCLDGTTESGLCDNGDNDLYRMIGLFKNDLNLYEIKLIKYDYANAIQLGVNGAYANLYGGLKDYYKGNQNINEINGYYWTNNTNQINDFYNSDLNNINLNDYYLNTYLKNNKGLDVDNLITNHIWKLYGYIDEHIEKNARELYNHELGITKVDNVNYPNSNTEIVNKIGLLYTSDYGYAAYSTAWSSNLNNYSTASIKDNNWIYMGLSEWTVSRTTINNDSAYNITSGGSFDNNPVFSARNAVRPTFYVSSKTTMAEGNGTKEIPYRLSIE